MKTFLLTLFVLCFGTLSAQERVIGERIWVDEVLNRTWQGIPGLERTAGGRLFFTWFTGDEREPRAKNLVLLCYSDDNGKTFSPLHIMAAPRDGMRCYDPTPWIDPKGRLWYIYSRSTEETSEHGVFARISENPDAPEPVFGPEFRIGFDVPFSFRMNKPTVLSTGEWILPVTYTNERIYAWTTGKAEDTISQLQGVSISRDEGRTWSQLYGAVAAPPWALESMIVELKDGRLWKLIRTAAGHLWESFSADKGITWSEGKESTIKSPGSRFFIRRLASGNLLMVNHHNFDWPGLNYNQRRSHLTAQISTDDGKTWNEGLLLDPRTRVSYPDGVQDKNGDIWIVYDHARYRGGDIVMARFREEDVIQGRNVSGTVLTQHLINRVPNRQGEQFTFGGGQPNPGVPLTIGNTVWAPVNVDNFQTFAAKPDMYTKFFQWNRAAAWPATGWIPVSEWDEVADPSPIWTINPCPTGWRLPARSEIRALNSAGNTWADAGTRGNAVAGSFFGPNHTTCTLPNNMNGCIFISAGGFRTWFSAVASQREGTIFGRYWTSDEAMNNEANGITLSFSNTGASITSSDKVRGNHVRCVKE